MKLHALNWGRRATTQALIHANKIFVDQDWVVNDEVLLEGGCLECLVTALGLIWWILLLPLD
jgi:hypothetical protein